VSGPIINLRGKFGAVGARRPGRPPAEATLQAKFVPEGAAADYRHDEQRISC